MTDQQQASEAGKQESSTIAAALEPKKWANKFETPEELEKAYGSLVGEMVTTNDIKKKYEAITTIPDDYMLPDGVQLGSAEAREIKAIAKNAGLSQDHFNKMAQEMASRIKNNVDVIETAKKNIGSEKLAILEDYVNTNYPESLRSTVLNQIIKDEKAQGDALKHRDEKLNSRVPGMDKANTQQDEKRHDGREELEKAALQYQRKPNEANRKKYINLAEEVGRERYGDKAKG